VEKIKAKTGSVYTGFCFIQGSVYILFCIIQDSVYSGFRLFRVWFR